jgi:hypothetical protein
VIAEEGFKKTIISQIEVTAILVFTKMTNMHIILLDQNKIFSTPLFNTILLTGTTNYGIIIREDYKA